MAFLSITKLDDIYLTKVPWGLTCNVFLLVGGQITITYKLRGQTIIYENYSKS